MCSESGNANGLGGPARIQPSSGKAHTHPNGQAAAPLGQDISVQRPATCPRVQLGRRPPGFSFASLLDEWYFFRITFWGLFGTDNAMADGLLYWAGDLAALAGGLGLLPLALSAGRPRKSSRMKRL